MLVFGLTLLWWWLDFRRNLLSLSLFWRFVVLVTIFLDSLNPNFFDRLILLLPLSRAYLIIRNFQFIGRPPSLRFFANFETLFNW